MASYLTTNFTHTYAGQEFLSELFFEPQVQGEDVFAEYRLMENIDSARNIYLPQSLNKILKKYTACGFSSTGSTTIDDKTIDVTKVKVNLEQCQDEFDDTIFGEARKKGVDIFDLTGTIIEGIIRTNTMNALREDIPRIAWMSKATSFSTDYDHFDGFFQLFFDSSATLACALDFSLDTDIESSDDILATDGALEAFRQLWEDQGAVMRAIPRSMKRFYVTSSIWDNLVRTLENTGTDSGLTRITDGTKMAFRGVPIVEMTAWDEFLADTGDNPQSANIGSHAIVYTIPDNLVIGTDTADARAQLKIRFSEDNETVRTTAAFKLGAQFIQPKLVCFGF